MMEIQIRVMMPEDYEWLFALWKRIKGLGIRSLDDSKEYVLRFIERNPSTSFVAQAGDDLVGSLMCGHDGRRGCFYHVCVDEEYRNRGIATTMVHKAEEALKREHISRVNLMTFKNNRLGEHFWDHLGWNVKEDVHLYERNLNEENVTVFNK